MRKARFTIISLAIVTPLLLLVAAWFQPLFTPSDLTRDPLAVVSVHASRGLPCCSRFTGAISTIGIMLWSAAAAVAVTGAIVLKALRDALPKVVFLASAGGLSIWLTLDDAFMLHEGYSPEIMGSIDVLKLIPLFALIPILTALVRARVTTDLAVFAGALLGLATSAVIDDFLEEGLTAVFIEDAFKFFGISLWLAFLMLKSIEFLLQAAAAPQGWIETEKPVDLIHPAQFRRL